MVYLISIVIGISIGLTLYRFEKERNDQAIDWTDIFIPVMGSLFGLVFFRIVLGIELTSDLVFLETILWSLLGILIIRIVMDVFAYEEQLKTSYSAVIANDFKPKSKKRKKITRK